MSDDATFRRLFEASSACSLLLSPALTIIAASDAYLRATLTERQAILGRSLFEVLPDNPPDPTATGAQHLRRSLETVLEHRRPDRMSVQKFAIRRPDSAGGGFEERHWRPENSPVLGAAGDVQYILHHIEDVTDSVRVARATNEDDDAARELAARSAERLGQLIDGAPDAIVVVRHDGTIELVNAQTETLFGYARAELVGQPLSVLIPERARVQHAALVEGYFDQPKVRAMSSGAELVGRHKDGREIPVEVSLSPRRGAEGLTVTAAIRDITERRRMQSFAMLASSRLESAVESIENAFALFDASDHLVLCNSAYRSLLADQVPGPILGKHYRELLDALLEQVDLPDDEARRGFRAERLASRSADAVQRDVRLRDGRTLRVSNRRTPEGGMVKTIWDLTADETRAAELREARSAAEAGSAAKSEFLSSMSHELRTPLNAVLGFAQLVERDKALSAKHRERIGHIRAGGEHLLRLIDDILDLARIEARGVSLSTEPVVVSEVLVEVQRTLEQLATSRSVAVGVAATESVPPVFVDRTRFAQILMNFGTNAIKYNRVGGSVRLRVSAPSAGRVRVTVEDNGLGISPDHQSKLFQPFQRAGQETGTIEGTGIGLAITRRLAALMGAEVGFESRVGEGSSFWVDVPVASAPPLPAPVASAAAPAQLVVGARRLLYIEDNPANVLFMQDVMSAFEGVELVTAPTAEMGIELATHHPPDAIIMDINLPGMSGLDALGALRARAETRTIPVIALSAAASSRDRERGERAGFRRYLTKPVKVDELLPAIAAVLGEPAPADGYREP